MGLVIMNNAVSETCIVKDLELAKFGQQEIEIARTEMPGLMALQTEYAEKNPLAGARIAGSLHMTIQTAVLIQSLRALGASVRWSSCNIYSTQDHAAAAMAVEGVPVFAKKGETLTEYWDYIDRIFQFDEGANMILDDGGDATLYITLGAQLEAGTDLPEATSEEEEALFAQIRERARCSPDWFRTQQDRIRGVTEETTTGVNRLRMMQDKGSLPFPAFNVNDSVTKSKFDNKYGCRESLVDGLRRATDTMIAGKIAVICGYGDVGKGCAASLRGAGARVTVTEVDPICALQAAMDGYEVVTLEDVASTADIFITATGNRDVIRLEHVQEMKNMAIIGNIGHFDNEIQIAALRQNHKWTNVKDQVDLIEMPSGKRILMLSEGRLLNLGNATGHPSFVMSTSFCNQVLAQIELWTSHSNYENKVYVLPKRLDEKVARLHLERLGIKLTKLTDEQAHYIGVDKDGPYKGEPYRY